MDAFIRPSRRVAFEVHVGAHDCELCGCSRTRSLWLKQYRLRHSILFTNLEDQLYTYISSHVVAVAIDSDAEPLLAGLGVSFLPHPPTPAATPRLGQTLRGFRLLQQVRNGSMSADSMTFNSFVCRTRARCAPAVACAL
eukprot:5472592-Pleurochrysis_carterae.AAC.7